MNSHEVVSMDLGSNSFRVLKYDGNKNKIVGEFNEVVGLADGLAKTGLISKDAVQRVVTAIKKAQEIVDFEPSVVRAVTTQAMRKASNNNEVLEEIKEKTGVDFEIIDGQEEARLTLLAIKYALQRHDTPKEKFILLDIGGGSTEISIRNENFTKSKSFEFGIVTMTQMFLQKFDLDKELEKRKKEVQAFIKEQDINLEEYEFIATAGTPTTIAAIKLGQDFFSYDKDVVNGSIVNLNDLESCLDIFRHSSKEDILKLVGRGRVEYIEVGIYIYQMIFEALEKQESIVFDDGLREGVAIKAYYEKSETC